MTAKLATHSNGHKPVADGNGAIPDIEQVLYLADKMLAAGEDPWELLTMAAAREEDDADKHRWNQCDLAAKVQKQYSENAIAAFARDAKLPVRRAKEYRTMGTFYERSARADFLSNHETLTYTHLRTATRLKSVESAMRFLDRADLRGWSSDKCEYVIGRMQRIYRDSAPNGGSQSAETEVNEPVQIIQKAYEPSAVLQCKEGRVLFQMLGGIPEEISDLIKHHQQEPEFQIQIVVTYRTEVS